MEGIISGGCRTLKQHLIRKMRNFKQEGRMNCKIGVISGDGIGPEIVREARKVLDRAAEKFGHRFDYTELLLGGASIDVHGVSLTEETIEKAKACDAVLMGGV